MYGRSQLRKARNDLSAELRVDGDEKVDILVPHVRSRVAAPMLPLQRCEVPKKPRSCQTAGVGLTRQMNYGAIACESPLTVWETLKRIRSDFPRLISSPRIRPRGRYFNPRPPAIQHPHSFCGHKRRYRLGRDGGYHVMMSFIRYTLATFCFAASAGCLGLWWRSMKMSDRCIDPGYVTCVLANSKTPNLNIAPLCRYFFMCSPQPL